jgi:NAD(P)-dependent dehydrogenase (short-subunit alcohol dehydrogenase family)
VRVTSAAAHYISAENRHVRDLFSLAGKVALVTGGAGRYGKYISLALAEAGATVLIASRKLAVCEDAALEFRNAGLDVHALELDLTNAGSVNAVADRIAATWNTLDVLVNNAFTISTGGFDAYSEEEWERVMSVNSTGLFRPCKVFGMMQRQGSVSIVNIGSIYGVVSPDFRAYAEHPEMISPPSYSFVKAGMVGLTQYLAVHFAPSGVRVNCLSPGGLYSPKMPKEFLENYCHRTPLGRLANCNDIKGAVVFLASDASAYMTGQNLLVDGGCMAL